MQLKLFVDTSEQDVKDALPDLQKELLAVDASLNGIVTFNENEVSEDKVNEVIDFFWAKRNHFKDIDAYIRKGKGIILFRVKATNKFYLFYDTGIIETSILLEMVPCHDFILYKGSDEKHKEAISKLRNQELINLDSESVSKKFEIISYVKPSSEYDCFPMYVKLMVKAIYDIRKK